MNILYPSELAARDAMAADIANTRKDWSCAVFEWGGSPELFRYEDGSPVGTGEGTVAYVRLDTWGPFRRDGSDPRNVARHTHRYGWLMHGEVAA